MVELGIEPETSGSAAVISDHWTTEVIIIFIAHIN
jgi:hypothetical protein